MILNVNKSYDKDQKIKIQQQVIQYDENTKNYLYQKNFIVLHTQGSSGLEGGEIIKTNIGKPINIETTVILNSKSLKLEIYFENNIHVDLFIDNNGNLVTIEQKEDKEEDEFSFLFKDNGFYLERFDYRVSPSVKIYTFCNDENIYLCSPLFFLTMGQILNNEQLTQFGFKQIDKNIKEVETAVNSAQHSLDIIMKQVDLTNKENLGYSVFEEDQPEFSNQHKEQLIYEQKKQLIYNGEDNTEENIGKLSNIAHINNNNNRIISLQNINIPISDYQFIKSKNITSKKVLLIKELEKIKIKIILIICIKLLIIFCIISYKYLDNKIRMYLYCFLSIIYFICLVFFYDLLKEYFKFKNKLKSIKC